MKNKKAKLIISSLLTLLPMAAGLILWNKLPELLTTHWGFDGQANGWAGRGMVTFVLPVALLLVHWLCLFVTSRDPKNANRGSVGNDIVFWIIPAVSNYAAAMVFATAFGLEADQGRTALIIFGLMFVIIGNKLPKVPQNYTLGIKVPWTMNNTENWNATHRFTGKLWFFGGLLIMLAVFLPEKLLPWILIGAILPLAFIPVLYSYLYYKKAAGRRDCQQGRCRQHPTGLSRKGRNISLALLILTLVGIAVLMFTGNINVVCGEESFTVEATFWADLTVDYDAVESIEYVPQMERGMRVNGYGSARLSLGMFTSSLGNHTRYCYNSCDSAVLLRADDKYLLLNGKDEAATRAIYEELTAAVDKNAAADYD